MPPKNNFSASRYINHIMLLTKEELEAFLPIGYYVILGKVCNSTVLSKEEFIDKEQKGAVDTVGFSYSLDHFSFLTIVDKGVVAKEVKPVIIIKPFSFFITQDEKILENGFFKEGIDFGFSISYPGLFSDGNTVVKTRGNFLEATVFDQIRIFKKENTFVAKFFLNKKAITTTFRIGKKGINLAKDKIHKISNLELIV